MPGVGLASKQQEITVPGNFVISILSVILIQVTLISFSCSIVHFCGLGSGVVGKDGYHFAQLANARKDGVQSALRMFESAGRETEARSRPSKDYICKPDS